jgi:putative endonuclease
VTSQRDETKSFAKRRAQHLRLGRRGERIAAQLLTELGLEVLVTNYRATRGEIDIVARENDVLCFVEVKTRRHERHARPADAVGTAKRRALVRAAHQYLREIGRPPLLYRYDIVEIVLDGWRLRRARYLPAAFNEEQDRSGLTFASLADLLDDL